MTVLLNFLNYWINNEIKLIELAIEISFISKLSEFYFFQIIQKLSLNRFKKLWKIKNNIFQDDRALYETEKMNLINIIKLLYQFRSIFSQNF